MLSEEQEKVLNLLSNNSKPLDLINVKTSSINTSEKKYIEYADYAVIIDGRIRELYKVKQEILTVINKINNPAFRTLLIGRYVNCKPFEEIAEEMNYSYNHLIKNIHPRALEAVERKKSP